MNGQADISVEPPTVEAVTGRPDTSDGSCRNKRFRRCVVRLIICLLAAAVGWAGFRLWSMQVGLQRARQAISRHQWSAARNNLDAYLTLHPRDAEAHFLMAEAWIRDDSRDAADHTDRAIHHLRRIDADSPLAAKARLQEGRLALLLRLQPSRAEKLLRESLRLDPDSYDTNLLLWKLLDLTGRHIESRDFFWRVYELSPRPERALRLRDWYFSEFFPELANLEFAQAMGAEQVGTIPAWINLLVRFREREPEVPYLHAALANHYLDAGNRKASLELLKEASDLQQTLQDPFYVSVLFETLVDMGEFARAETCFRSWPEPRSGYLYWRAEGLFFQQVQKDAEAATVSYRKALATWPAKYDWYMTMNLAECLRKTGHNDEARGLQARVDHLTERYLTKEKTRSLRLAIADLSNADAVTAMRDMFREFGLTREAEAWDLHRKEVLRLPLREDRN